MPPGYGRSLVSSTGLSYWGEVGVKPVVAGGLINGALVLRRLHRDLCLVLSVVRLSLPLFAHCPLQLPLYTLSNRLNIEK